MQYPRRLHVRWLGFFLMANYCTSLHQYPQDLFIVMYRIHIPCGLYTFAYRPKLNYHFLPGPPMVMELMAVRVVGGATEITVDRLSYVNWLFVSQSLTSPWACWLVLYQYE